MSGEIQMVVVDAGVDVPDADRAHDADAAEAEERWEQFERRRGAVPPLAFADAALADVRVRVDALVDGLVTELAGRPFTPDAVSVEVAFADHGGRDVVVAGVVPGVCGDLVVEVTASKLKAKHLLTAWVRLAVLALHDPSRPWESLTVGAQPSNTTKAAVQRLRLRSPEAAARVLEVVVDLHRRALCDTVPAFPETTRFVWMGEPGRARGAWGDGWRGE